MEYEDVLTRKTTGEVARNVLRLLMVLPNVEQIAPHFRWGLIHTDPDDNKFVDCALAANADAIITHDTHFDVLKTVNFPQISVMTARELDTLLRTKA